MQIHLPDTRFISPSSFYSSTSRLTSPAVDAPASPFHPLLADRSSAYSDFSSSPDHLYDHSPAATDTMDVGNILSLQTQAAHGLHRPQAQPVQVKPKKASSSSVASSSSSASSSTASIALRCTRCRRSISLDENSANSVSFGSHLHYCSSCTKLLESRG